VVADNSLVVAGNSENRGDDSLGWTLKEGIDLIQGVIGGKFCERWTLKRLTMHGEVLARD